MKSGVVNISYGYVLVTDALHMVILSYFYIMTVHFALMKTSISI